MTATLEKIYKVPPLNVEVSQSLFRNATNLEVIHFTKELLDEKVEPYWQAAVDSWWYSRPGFDFGKDDTKITPRMCPLICDLTFNSGKEYHLPTLGELLRIVLDNSSEFRVNTSNDKNGVLIGRFMQTYAGLMREFAVVRYLLDKVGKIIKDYHFDLEHNADLIIDDIHPLGVQHEGKGTAKFDHIRKYEKKIEGAYTLWVPKNRPWTPNLELPRKQDMDDYLKVIENYKNPQLVRKSCAFC